MNPRFFFTIFGAVFAGSLPSRWLNEKLVGIWTIARS